MKRKLLSLLLAATMVTSMFHTAVFAAPAEKVTEGDVECVVEAEDDYLQDETKGGIVETEENPVQSAQEEKLPNAAPDVDGTNYTVDTTENFNNAVAAIKASDDTEATIVFNADEIEVESFAGIEGKHITLKSAEKQTYALSGMGMELIGDLTFDNVKAYNEYSKIYSNGHLFETTGRFSAIKENGTIGKVFGGGNSGEDVSGDTNLVLRGGRFDWVFGGGYDSNVSGSTNILVDGIITNGASSVRTGNLYGGGVAEMTSNGTVERDANIVFRQGSNGMIFGGGRNIYSKDKRDAARVSGTANVTIGYDGAPDGVANTGTAMHTYGGSWNSTVGNVILKLLDGSTNKASGGDRTYFGCGYRDTVLGTVLILVDGSDLNKGGYIYGGGGEDTSMNEHYDPIQILNESNEEYALKIQYNSNSANTDGGINAGSDNSVPMEIEGNVLLEMKEGNIAFCVLDNENVGNCAVSGNSEILIYGGRIAQIEGNKTQPANSTVTYDTCGTVEDPQESGYINRAGKVILKNEAQVEINSLKFDQFSSGPQKPFYNVTGLELQQGSKLTTSAGQAWVYGDVILNGTWDQQFSKSKDYFDLYVKNNFISNRGTLISHGTSSLNGTVTANGGKMVFRNPAIMRSTLKAEGTEIRLPVMQPGTNYPDVDIPLNIKGAVTGNAKVYTMDNAEWTIDVIPVVGENYIVALRDGSEKVFQLSNADAIAEGLYFKKLADADAESPDNDMWQVAKGYAVTYDANGGNGTLTDPNSPYEPDAAVTVLGNSFTYTSKLFKEWNTKPDGTGTKYQSGATFSMPAENVVLYAQWESYSIPTPPTTYKVTYEGNGGEGTLTDDNSPYKPADTVTVLANSFTHIGKLFKEWNTKPDGSGTKYQSGETFSMPAEDVVLYAQWESNPIPPTTYTVTYDGNGGKGTLTDDNSPYKAADTVTVLGNSFTHTGKLFKEWNTKPDETGTSYQAGENFAMPAENVTLYAVWETTGGGTTKYYHLTYKTNGGSAVPTLKAEENSTVELKQVSKRKGYTFKGWYAEKTLKTKITSVYMDKDKTVYAKWTKNTVAPPTKQDKPIDPYVPKSPTDPYVPQRPATSEKATNHRTNSPETGDASNIALWLVLLFASAGVILNFSLKRKKSTSK